MSTTLLRLDEWADSATARPTAGDAITWRGARLLVVGTLLAANLTLVVGKHTGIFDAAEFFCPYFMLTADYARHGQLLHWTPLVNAGAPAGADPQVGAFSPLVVGLGWLTGGREFGFRLYWLLAWAAAGLGVVTLARHLAAPAWAACLAAVAYMFSGVFVGHAQHTPYLVGMAALPWMIWRWDVALTGRAAARAAGRPPSAAWSAAVEAGAIWGLAALAGHPGMVITGACYVALWTLGRMFIRSSDERAEAAVDGSPWRQRTARRIAWPLAALAVFALVGLVVMAPSYVAFLTETPGYSDRSGPLPREVATSVNSLHPAAVRSFASPYLAVVQRFDARLFPGTDASMCSLYVCPLLLVLAAVSLCSRRADRFRWYLAGVGALFLLTAMGAALPLRGWLYDWLPPMRYFRHAGLFRCYAVFTVVVLAPLAARELHTPGAANVRRNAWRRWAWLLAIGAAMAAAAIGWAVATSTAGREPGRLVLPLVHWAIVWPLAAMIVWQARRSPEGPGSLAVPRRLLLLVAVDAVLTVAISKPLMFTDRAKLWDAVEAEHTASVELTTAGLARQRGAATFGQGAALNANLPTKTPTLVSYTPMSNARYDALAAHPILSAAAMGPQRMWFASTVAQVEPNEAAWERFLARVEQLRQPVVVVSPAEASPPRDGTAAVSIAALPAAQPIAVSLTRYAPSELQFDVVCPADGWLLVTDRWAPRWTVSVNGQPQELLRGNFVFRAVRVSVGENRVRFTYRPVAGTWLVAASWTTLGVVAIGAWRRRRRMHRTEAERCRA